jgi:hypothetical protein
MHFCFTHQGGPAESSRCELFLHTCINFYLLKHRTGAWWYCSCPSNLHLGYQQSWWSRGHQILPCRTSKDCWSQSQQAGVKLKFLFIQWVTWSCLNPWWKQVDSEQFHSLDLWDFVDNWEYRIRLISWLLFVDCTTALANMYSFQLVCC